MPQKNPDSWRIVGDFRRLNASTIPDPYSVSHLSEFSSKLHGCTLFSKVDVRAFFQITVAEEDVNKTAIITPFGLYRVAKDPLWSQERGRDFSTLHRFCGWGPAVVFAYFDDLLIFSSSPKKHRRHLQLLFERLQKLTINLSKARRARVDLENELARISG